MADKEVKERLVTAPFVAMFPNLEVARKSKPRKGEAERPDAKAKYGVTALWLDPDNLPAEDLARHKAVLRLLAGVSLETFGKKWSELDPRFYAKGIRENSSREHPFEHPRLGEKPVFANLTTEFKPDIVDVRGRPIGKEYGNESLIYPGCLMRASVNAYAFKGDDNKGVGLSLNNIIVVSSNMKAWPRLDNRKSAAEEFSDIDDSAWLGDEDEPDARYDSDGDDDY